MSNEEQLTPIMEAIKYAKKRMEYWETQYECFEEEREFDSARRCKLVASELNDHIQFLQSLLPKEEKEIKTDVEFLCKWCSNEKLMNIFQEEAQEMQDTLAWKKALLETFKTESDETQL